MAAYSAALRARLGLARKWEMTMGRILSILQVCCCMGCVLAMVALVNGQESTDAAIQKLAEESRSRAEGIQVRVGVGDRTTKATVHPTPIMRYTDVPRLIEMATLWVWHDEGRPVALANVEAYRRRGGPKWLYCFTSISSELIEAQWPDDRRFQARKPGIEWTAINGPVLQETAAGRLRQMKALFHRFSATARDEVLKTTDDLRPLARPLHEYSSPKNGVIHGILCGFAANGTNPDLIIALEAVRPAKGKHAPKSWRYGVIGMTAEGVTVKLDGAEVFDWPYARSTGDRDTWTWFWEGAPRK
jgi:hypothetical protein